MIGSVHPWSNGGRSEGRDMRDTKDKNNGILWRNMTGYIWRTTGYIGKEQEDVLRRTTGYKAERITGHFGEMPLDALEKNSWIHWRRTTGYIEEIPLHTTEKNDWIKRRRTSGYIDEIPLIHCRRTLDLLAKGKGCGRRGRGGGREEEVGAETY